MSMLVASVCAVIGFLVGFRMQTRRPKRAQDTVFRRPALTPHRRHCHPQGRYRRYPRPYRALCDTHRCLRRCSGHQTRRRRCYRRPSNMAPLFKTAFICQLPHQGLSSTSVNISFLFSSLFFLLRDKPVTSLAIGSDCSLFIFQVFLFISLLLFLFLSSLRVVTIFTRENYSCLAIFPAEWVFL